MGNIYESKRLLRDGELQIATNREYFTHLGPWRHQIYSEGIGWAYRVGIKDNFLDSKGNLAVLIILFSTALSNQKNVPDKIIEKILNQANEEAIESMAKAATSICDNVVAAIQNPPEYMLKELEESLK